MRTPEKNDARRRAYSPTIFHSDKATYNFYNIIDKILQKQYHYTVLWLRTSMRKSEDKQHKWRQDYSAWASEMRDEIGSVTTRNVAKKPYQKM